MLNVCQARNRETIGPPVYPPGGDQATFGEVDFGVNCGDGKRTRAFTELVSHYLFADRFGRPDNDKVERLHRRGRDLVRRQDHGPASASPP